MPKTAIKEMYRQLELSLTEKNFLREIGMQKKTMIKLIVENNWKGNIEELFSLKEITCKDILAVSKATIEEIEGCEKEYWLETVKNCISEELFPRSDQTKRTGGVEALLRILRLFIDYQNERKGFDPTVNISFLSEAEIDESGIRTEYLQFVKFWKEKYVYEFMTVFNELTAYNTRGHIAGVHFTAMNMARQLKQVGVPIDLALISAAAAGHDLGKYGCRTEEASKIPYLHYYYTNQLLKENNMPIIAHIASNHSTWDLELENLSVESLVLIYSDFRVKSTRDAEGVEKINFYSLKDSFDVILNKLDNVDEKKRRRYMRVYSKLVDFEAYMKNLGVSTQLTSCEAVKPKYVAAALLDSDSAIERLKFLAIEHNITLMNKFNNDTSFANLLEAARSEKQWKNIRAYLNIFSEYSTYMTQKQKLVTMNFLYELLMHREGDIRRHAGSIMADIIANYNEKFRKELPKDAHIEQQETTSLSLWKNFLQDIIFPDYKVTEQHKRWVGYSLKTILATLIMKCENKGEREEYLDAFFAYFSDTAIEAGTAFTLLGGLMAVPLEHCSGDNIVTVMAFGAKLAKRQSLEIKIGVLRFAEYAVSSCLQSGVRVKIKPYAMEIMDSIADELVSAMFLKYKILEAFGEPSERLIEYEQKLYKEARIESDLYLENLKVGTPWGIKEVNIEFLLDKLNRGIYREKLHVATHLSNLIKVSERVTVRHSAGKGLLRVIESLSLDQRNEIIIELTKGLEIGEYQFSKYIPEYLGELAMYLHPRELDELIKDLRKLEDSTNSRIACVTLDTLGVMVKKYGEYRERFEEKEGAYEERRELMLGMLLRGLANYDHIVRQEAFLVIGQNLFENNQLTLEEKNVIFQSMYKKVLALIADRKENELGFFNSSAALNQLYRFISDYSFEKGGFEFYDNEKIAFFPGTFDPFSLSHKGIVKEIRKLGFQVYLALDEFSWSKKTQPRIIRKQIVSMSVADERDVYIFPENIAVNIANPADLKELRDIFAGKEVYMVVGSDVVDNASSYKKNPEPYSIHYMNHIVFKRMSEEQGKTEGELGSSYDCIKGKVLELKLPMHLEDISSTRIRENIDNNRDISNLIDTVAQNYIYQNSLYMREPQYKSVMSAASVDFEIVNGDNAQIFSCMGELVDGSSGRIDALRAFLENKEVGAIVAKSGNTGNKSNDCLGNKNIGMVLFHELDTLNLYSEFNDANTASFIREQASGKIIAIDMVAAKEGDEFSKLEQLLLTEALAYCLGEGFTYAVYNPVALKNEKLEKRRLEEVFELQGFVKIADDTPYDRGVYFVDMKSPIIIFENMEMRIKAPFNENVRVLGVLRETYKTVQHSLTQIYRGQLVLSFNAGVVYHKLVNMLTEENGVPREEARVRTLGPYMCVPFGKTLEGMAVPNTVTKSLHTEKVFDAEVKEFTIREYPYYATLENQIITIKSFGRPILLVDDLLHKGYRIKELDHLFKENGLEINKILVGVLSGRGKDLMAIQGRKVGSPYFIPNLRTWFTDDNLYPFIGGDSIEREYLHNSNLIPSINLILPYSAPSFLAGEDRGAVFDFSLTCLKSARSILKVLEEEFQKSFERNLTLNRLNEVIISPRCPDKGGNVVYDENLPPSGYVTNDIEKLMRLKNII